MLALVLGVEDTTVSKSQKPLPSWSSHLVEETGNKQYKYKRSSVSDGNKCNKENLSRKRKKGSVREGGVCNLKLGSLGIPH